MPGEVAEIALMTDSLGLPDSSMKAAVSSLDPVIGRAKAGDAAAFEQIIEFYQRKVLTTAWRMLGDQEDARDAAQEVFLRVYKYLAAPVSQLGAPGCIASLQRCRDQLRKRAIRSLLLLDGTGLGI